MGIAASTLQRLIKWAHCSRAPESNNKKWETKCKRRWHRYGHDINRHSVAGAELTMMDNLGVAMNATNIEAYALGQRLRFYMENCYTGRKSRSSHANVF